MLEFIQVNGRKFLRFDPYIGVAWILSYVCDCYKHKYLLLFLTKKKKRKIVLLFPFFVRSSILTFDA